MKKYVRESIARFRQFSIEKKLKWLRMVVIIPALVGIITLLVIMINFNESYNEAVKNVSVASKFNFSFSEDMDYKMYRIVIGAESFDTMKPYEEIKEAKELVKELNKNAVTDESKLRTRQIGKLLDNLKISIEEIEHSDLKNDYMENNQRLRLNVNVFTEIIKEKVSEYIYYEIGNMESMRVKLEKEIMHTITITLIAVLFLSLITWKLSKLISQSISYPVRQLCEMTKEVAQGNFDVHGPQNTTEELQILTNNFEHMAQKVERLIEDVKVEQQNLRKKELQLLQEQINPHFLYNTLEGIRSEAIMAGLDNLADMTEALAIFFRYTISKVENLVTVEEELENCATYFKIQQYRFGSRIHLEIEQDEEDWDDILHCMIPKLTLQPILENSIIHGIELKLDEGKVTISISRTKSRLLIKVSDDGVGMNRETLDKLNAKLGSKEEEVKNYTQPEKGGVALVNVNNRIHLIFGEEYGMHVYSLENMGTSVELSIPVIYNENELKKKDK